MSSDILYLILIDAGHIFLSAILFWWRPISWEKLLTIVIYTSWFAAVMNMLGVISGLFIFPSQVVGMAGGMLAYAVLGLPFKILPYLILLGSSWKINTLSAAIFAGIVTYLEWLTLNNTSLIQEPFRVEGL
jgi:hypothetical protein